MPTCHGLDVYRLPCLLLTCALRAGRASGSTVGASVAGAALPRGPCGQQPKHTGRRLAAQQQQPGARVSELSALASAPGSTYYVLNPGGDLEDTQKCFEALFERQEGWQVRGAHPASWPLPATALA